MDEMDWWAVVLVVLVLLVYYVCNVSFGVPR